MPKVVKSKVFYTSSTASILESCTDISYRLITVCEQLRRLLYNWAERDSNPHERKPNGF